MHQPKAFAARGGYLRTVPSAPAAELRDSTAASTSQALAQSPSLVEHISLDLGSGELWRGRHCIALQEQPFEVLRLLLERTGQVVGREELCHRLWPDGTFVDYEHSLNAAIARLRRALGDDAVRPRFIETIPRRGYRLVVRIPETGGTAQVTRSPDPGRRRLAVLPLADLGAGTHFTEGLTEELIVKVSRVSADAVALIARTSSALADVARRPSEIGQALRADLLLGGSVRAEGDRGRIAAWLVETAGETHVWTDAVDCALQAPLAAQVDVATRLAESLDVALRMHS